MILTTSSSKGFSLVEIVIGTALIALALVGLAGSYSFLLRSGLRTADSLKATLLAEEGIEAVGLLRDASWGNLSSLSVGTPYYLSWEGNAWVLTATPALIDGVFTRTILFDDLYRRVGDNDIVASTSPAAKTLDADIREVTVRVTGGDTNAELVSYLANLFE